MADAPSLPLRPSGDLAVLEQQLLKALSRLEHEGDIQGPESYRPFLRQAQVLAWQGVAHRRPDAPREVLNHLQSVQPFIGAFLPKPADPKEEAALALCHTLDSLYLADGALAETRVESRLANRDLSLMEREVLRVLLVHRDRYLRRGEVQKLLNLMRPPTPARISQILVSLDHQNLLTRMQGRAQGNPEASFYALSPQGLEVCKRLSLDRRRAPYFRLEEESWKAWLTPERIAVREDTDLEPGRVTTVWSYRGGVGRTSAIAQAAPLLAERLRESNSGRLLVMDFDLDSPGLDTHFAPAGLGECRGLRGLIVDFYKTPPAERPKWLRKALLAPGYVLVPKPEEHPNLHYLPSGFGTGSTPGLDEERAEALDRLQSEARRRLGDAYEEGEDTGPTFLFELRAALGEELYARTLIDPQAGFGLTAWAAILELADQLVLAVRSTYEDFRPFQIALGNFLYRRSEKAEESTLRVGFLIKEAGKGIAENLEEWIEKKMFETQQAREVRSYRIVAIRDNEHSDWLGLLEGCGRARRKQLDPMAALIRRCIERALAAKDTVEKGNVAEQNWNIAAAMLANAPDLSTRLLALKTLTEMGIQSDGGQIQDFVEHAIDIFGANARVNRRLSGLI